MHENREISCTSWSTDQDRSAKAINRTADMNVQEKSDCAVVPVNQPNNEGQQPSAEAGGGRAQTEENIVPSHMRPTQSGKRMSLGLDGVRQAARKKKQEQFTALLHHLSVGLLRDSFYALFASGDSVTRAHLHAVVDKGYEEDSAVDPKVAEYLHISEAFERAAEFDLIHSHYDFMALTYTRLVKTPVLTTIHGFSSPKIMPVYQKYRDGYFVSISDSDRAAGLNYLATVYNGIDLSLYPLQEPSGDDLIFLGRIHPDKGVHLAIEVARLSGLRLIIAGMIQDEAYFREQVKPHLDNQNIRYVGPVGVPGKNELFARARALLHLNTIPERFGLVLVEANAAGVPVIAMDLGSCREVIKDGQTGFLVNNVNEAVRALERLSEIDRTACRQRVQQCFSIKTMVEAYERVYSTIFELEEKRQS